MTFTVSKPVRRLLLLLVFGVAPIVFYLGFLRPSGRAEYFLQENLRDLEVLSEQLGAIWSGYLGSIKFAGERGAFGHLKGTLSPPRPAHRSKAGREDDLDCGGQLAECSAELRIVESAPALPMSNELQHTFDAADTSGVTKQSSDLVVSSACKCSGSAHAPFHRTLKISLDSIIGSLLRNSELAEYELFLANAAGAVRFEHGPRGTRLLQFAGDATGGGEPKKDTTAAKAAAAVPKLNAVHLSEFTGQTMVTEVEAMGRRFQLLTVPFEVATQLDGSNHAEPRSDTSKTWILGLLVSSDRLTEKARTFSYGSWSSLPLLLLAALLSIPIIKVRSIGPRQAFSQRDVHWLAGSLVAVPTIVATVLLALFTYTAWEQRMDEQLRHISEQMQSNFKDEIAAAGAALDAFIQQRAVPRASELPKQPGAAFECVVDQSTKDNPCIGSDYDLQTQLNIYPFFDFVLWADRDGRQWEKWSVEKKATPLINMRDYHPHYQALIDRRTERTIHTQLSPLTGQPITVLSKPFGNGTQTLGVAALVWSPLSLVGAVVPPGIGYAVVEDRGRVVFHNVSRRSLYENFLDETNRGEAIGSLIQGGRNGIIEAHYHGRSHRLYVHPLATMPWSLIVFRDKEIVRAADLDIILTWAAGMLLFVATWLFVRGLVRLTLGRADVLWYWPDPEQGHVYTQIGVVLGLWLVAMTWLLLSPPARVPLLMLATAFASAPLLTSLVFLRLARVRPQADHLTLRNRRWLARGVFVAAAACFIAAASASLDGSFPKPDARGAAIFVILALVLLTSVGLLPRLDRLWREWAGAWRRPYVASGILLIVVVAVLPSLILYSDALDCGMTVFVRHGQLKLAQRLASRADKILRRYVDRSDVMVGKERLLAGRSRLDARWHWANAAQGLFWDGKLNAATAPSGCGSQSDGKDTSLFWPNEWLGCSLAGDGGLIDRHFSAPLLACMPVYSPETVELRSLVYSEATRSKDDPCVEPPWKASTDAEHRSSLTVSDWRFSDKGNQAAVRTLTSAQAIPTLPTPTGWLGWSLLVLAILALGALLFATVEPIARQLFGFALEPSSEATASTTAEPPAHIWSLRSDEEKSLLYSLTKTGLVTPHPRAWQVVKTLTEVGLLRLQPEPRFADERVRDFVANTSTEADIQTWQAGGQGNWDTIRSVAQAAAVLIGVGLYFTQAEALTQWSGALTAATGLAGSLVTAMGAFRQDKSKEKSP